MNASNEIYAVLFEPFLKIPGMMIESFSTDKYTDIKLWIWLERDSNSSIGVGLKCKNDKIYFHLWSSTIEVEINNPKAYDIILRGIRKQLCDSFTYSWNIVDISRVKIIDDLLKIYV